MQRLGVWPHSKWDDEHTHTEHRARNMQSPLDACMCCMGTVHRVRWGCIAGGLMLHACMLHAIHTTHGVKTQDSESEQRHRPPPMANSQQEKLFSLTINAQVLQHTPSHVHTSHTFHMFPLTPPVVTRFRENDDPTAPTTPMNPLRPGASPMVGHGECTAQY